MARPFLVPVAFATALFSSTAAAHGHAAARQPAVAAHPASPTAAEPAAAVSPAPPTPAIDVASAPQATHAAGNARLPLYDDACMASKAPSPLVCP